MKNIKNYYTFLNEEFNLKDPFGIKARRKKNYEDLKKRYEDDMIDGSERIERLAEYIETIPEVSDVINKIKNKEFIKTKIEKDNDSYYKSLILRVKLDDGRIITLRDNISVGPGWDGHENSVGDCCDVYHLYVNNEPIIDWKEIYKELFKDDYEIGSYGGTYITGETYKEIKNIIIEFEKMKDADFYK